MPSACLCGRNTPNWGLSGTPGTESSLTLRWREPDSNHRSRSCERHFWASPIGDDGGATYRFSPRRQCLPGVAPHSLSLRGGTASSNPSSSAAVCLSGVPRTVSAKVAQRLAWPADRSRHQKTGTHDAGFGNAWVGDRSAAIGGLPGAARREAAAWQMAYPMITTSRADRPESNCHGKPCPRYSMPDT